MRVLYDLFRHLTLQSRQTDIVIAFSYILLNILGAIIGYYIYRLVAYLLNETRLNRKKEFICNLVTIILAVAAVLYLGV